jgi:tetratricopeptide (TPR) repeat protein
VAHLAGPQALPVAFCLHQLGAKDHAERVFASATASTAAEGPGPETSAAVSYLWQTGQRSRAEAILDALLETDPFENVPILWRFAALLAEEQGQYELADRSYELAFNADPTNAEILRNRALALIETGRGAEARGLLQTLASGSWNPKHAGLQTQAKRALASQSGPRGASPPEK